MPASVKGYIIVQVCNKRHARANESNDVIQQHNSIKASNQPLPDTIVLLATVGHAPLNLGGVEMAVFPGRHGGLHLAGAHPLECLGHLRLGVILRVASLDVGQQIGEGSTLDREFGGPVHLVGDGLAPLSIMAAFCGREGGCVWERKEKTWL